MEANKRYKLRDYLYRRNPVGNVSRKLNRDKFATTSPRCLWMLLIGNLNVAF